MRVLGGAVVVRPLNLTASRQVDSISARVGPVY